MKVRHTHIVMIVLLLLTACTGDLQHMRERLQYVADCNRADTVFTVRWLPTADSLARYFTLHGSANERLMAHYLQGRVRHDMGDAPQALDCYQRAAELADTTRADCDLYTLYAVYGQMAYLFHAQFLPDDELQASKMAERVAWLDKDTLAALTAKELRTRPFFLKNDTDSVLVTENVARSLYLHYGYKEKAAQAILGSISIYLDRNQYKTADSLMAIYEAESGLFSDGKSYIRRGSYCYDKGRYLLGMGQPDEASAFFKRALSAGNHEAAYRGLLDVYKAKLIPDSIAKYAELFAAANDASYEGVAQEVVHQSAALYNYQRHQHIAEQERQLAANWMAGSLIVGLVALLTIASLIIVFYRSKAKRLQEICDLTDEKLHLETLLRREENATEEAKKEILRLNNKNSSISKVHKEKVSKLQAQIATLQEKLSDASRMKNSDTGMESVISDFQSRFNEYHKGIQIPTTLEWTQLKEAFAYIHRSGYQLLTSTHGMTEEQIRVCLMTVLDISESLMAFVLDTDSRRIDRVKRQANKKLFGEDKASTLKGNLRPYFL